MADAPDSKSGPRKGVGVQVSPPVLRHKWAVSVRNGTRPSLGWFSSTCADFPIFPAYRRLGIVETWNSCEKNRSKRYFGGT